ncbi:MAG: aminotransferase class III-fold pyridoxal phosphate-dependent enzyme [Firmicutes bacterium]|nr:aminotransferase class III-fold pyridoxal phosphate-dependent enzyme [Bacillota bacterium]
MHPFARYVNPHLADLLAKIDMDKRFVRGEGCRLYDSSGRAYLDLIASYGALPFGHNPPRIWRALESVRSSSEPSFVQPSYLEAAGELAERLIAIAPAGLKYVTFTNSGAEATEAAIKMCRAASGRRRILATWNSFHGKTLGALSATGRAAYQKPFGAPVEGFDFVAYGDAEALDGAFNLRGGEYAAFLVEPIQGEGGIVVPPEGYLRRVRELCDRYGVLLVVDEIQTGLGRTGRMFACEEEGISPDVMLLAKALGGGLVPIGAVLSSERAYTEEFAMKHSSTFAGNTLACRAGIAAIDLLTEDDCALIRNVTARGRVLRSGLDRLRERYPEVVAEARGRGLMLGIKFSVSREDFPNCLMGVMAEQELLTPVISSYLLNVERLRVAPTLNGADVIRIEPPLVIGEGECERALEGIENAVRVVARRDTARLLGHLVPGGFDTYPDLAREPARPHAVARSKPSPSGDPAEARFAFLVHPIDLRNYCEVDPSLSAFSEGALRELASRWNSLVDPFVLSQARIVSPTGASAYGEFIAVPRTSEELLNDPPGETSEILKFAVRLARDRGARIVGLGAYTSVASHGGLHLLNEGVAITTGNSYTVVSAVEAVVTALARLGVDPSRATVSVVGATGSIGRATAMLLSEVAGRIVLIGNPRWPERARRRLADVARAVYTHLATEARRGRVFPEGSVGHSLRSPRAGRSAERAEGDAMTAASLLEEFRGSLVLTTEIDRYLGISDVVVTATSSLGAIVTPTNVKHGAVVCDLSRPPNVSRRIVDERPDVLAIDGGVVALPGRPSLGWDFGFETGLAYACMAETIMLALEHRFEHASIGADLNMDEIGYMRQLAEKHGFRLADLRSFDRPMTPVEWERVIAARRRVREAAVPAED